VPARTGKGVRRCHVSRGGGQGYRLK